jgi:hypothetical protein
MLKKEVMLKVKGVNLVDDDGKVLEQMFIDNRLNERKTVIVAVHEESTTKLLGCGNNLEMAAIAGALIEKIADLTGDSITNVSTGIVSALLMQKARRDGFESVADELMDGLKRVRDKHKE